MTLNGWLQIALFLGLVVALIKPLGLYMARVFNGDRTFLDPVMRPIGFFGETEKFWALAYPTW